MTHAVAQIHTLATLPAAFARNMDVCPWPVGVTSQGIVWSSDYGLVKDRPNQSLIDVPSVQTRYRELSDGMSALRGRLYMEPEERSDQRSLAAAYSELQDIAEEAGLAWQRMDNPSIDINELALKALDEEVDHFRVAVMLIEGIGNKASNHSAAEFFLKSAERYMSPNAEALLKELAYVGYAKYCSRVNEPEKLLGTFLENLEELRTRAIASWLNALGATHDPVQNDVHIFGGVRACLSSPAHYTDMIPFIKRYGELHPEEAFRNELRIVWARLAHKGNAVENWRSALFMMDDIIEKWEKDAAYSSQVSKLKGLQKNVERLMSKRSRQAS